MTATHTPDEKQNAPEPSQNPSNAPPAEQTHFQILSVRYDDASHFYREGLPTTDLAACQATAIELMANKDVKEVFVATVHSAYTKEINIKKVI